MERLVGVVDIMDFVRAQVDLFVRHAITGSVVHVLALALRPHSTRPFPPPITPETFLRVVPLFTTCVMP